MAEPFSAALARKMMPGNRFRTILPRIFEIIKSAATQGSIEVEFDEPFTRTELRDFHEAKDGCLLMLIKQYLEDEKWEYSVKSVQQYRVLISWEVKIPW